MLISGHLTEEWGARAREGGFDVVLEKPLKTSAIKACVGSLIAA